MRSVKVLGLTLATALAMAFAGQAAGENVLRWASAGGVLTWDPHGSTTETPSLVGFRQVYESLNIIDADLRLRPGLATSWQLIDPTSWRFELRRGVSFHDGTPFSAADVVFSIERARAAGSDLAAYTTSIAAVRAIGDAAVEIATRHPDMLLPVNLRQVAILSKAWAERHGIAAARPFDKGAPPLDQANGTGPFMLDSHETGRRTVLVRNPDWWGSAEAAHNLDRIVWSIVPDPRERLALLLNGETDFVQDPPLEALSSIRSRPGLRLVETGELRVLLLGLNQGTPELLSGDIAGANPFKDKRVRQALYEAIDIEAIRDGVMAGLAIPTGITIPPGVNGYAPELDRRLSYDPQRAKALLAEAVTRRASASPSTVPTTATSTTRRSAGRWPRILVRSAYASRSTPSRRRSILPSCSSAGRTSTCSAISRRALIRRCTFASCITARPGGGAPPAMPTPRSMR
jgi:peptide/nickel transport system substrate-binding protein